MVRGIVTPRRIGEPLVLGIGAARAEFGYGVMNPANTIREVIEAIGALPWDDREQDMVNLAIQFDPRKSSGEFLEAGLWPLASRQQPAAAAGIVHLHYKSIVTGPTPLFTAGDLEFVDGAGIRFVGTDDIDPPTTIHDTSGQTGTLSETIGSANTQIAQKVRVTDNDFPQAIRFAGLSIISGSPVATVRLETDSAGDPSGILADDRLEVTGLALAAGTNDVIFNRGAKLATADYWIVVTVTGGTVKFDGGAGGAANQVKFHNGAWAVSAVPVENLNVKLYNGGEFPVVATQLGAAGNIVADSMATVRPNSGVAQDRYALYVSSFENLEVFEGGRDLEEDEQLRSRVRLQSAARGTSSPGGIIFGLLDGNVPGVTFADILENDTMDWGSEEPILNNSTKTGTDSDLVDGVTYTRIAQRFVVTARRSISAIAFKLAADAASTITFRVEADAAGSPSGTLVSPDFERTGFVPAGTTRRDFTFADGDFIDAGTYWLVLTRTAGTFRVDGSAAGATDNVKRYTGAAWELSTVVEDLNVEIYGGVPPKSFQVFVEGGSDDDVAQAIYDLRAPGIMPYGVVAGNAQDFAGRTVVQRFNRPENIDEVVSVIVQVTAEFTGTEDDIRDLVTEYLAELGIGDTFVRTEAMGRLIQGDSRTVGVFDVTRFRLGKKAEGFATPVALGAGQEVNLTLNFGQRHRIANPATDIAVQIDAAPV